MSLWHKQAGKAGMKRDLVKWLGIDLEVEKERTWWTEREMKW